MHCCLTSPVVVAVVACGNAVVMNPALQCHLASLVVIAAACNVCYLHTIVVCDGNLEYVSGVAALANDVVGPLPQSMARAL